MSPSDSIWFLTVVDGVEDTNTNLKFKAILNYFNRKLLVPSILCDICLFCVKIWLRKSGQPLWSCVRISVVD